MTTLVTGATGFVGSHLVDELLRRGEPVRALVRDAGKAAELRGRGVEAFVGDLCDPGTLTAPVHGMEVVYHCGAAVGPTKSRAEIYAVNRDGVRNLVEAARQAGKPRVVLLSSVNVLGTRDLDPATEELSCRRSHDPAADVKIEAEQIAFDYHRRHGLPVVIIRPGFIYGPRDGHNLPRLAQAIRKGKFVFLGSRDNVVPIVHVSDVAQALVRAADRPAAVGRAFHITDGSRTTIGEFVDHLAGLLNCRPPQKVLPLLVPKLACVVFELLQLLRLRKKPGPINRPGLRFLGTSRWVDITRAREELGYSPQVNFRQGVADALRWIKEHSDGQAELVHTSA